MVDLTAIDWFRKKEPRFEVVVNFLSVSKNKRISILSLIHISEPTRQADLMIVAGRVSQKMAPVLRQVYDQMAEPKWVIAMGACSSTGGMFNNYALVQGVDHIVPVDIYVPGCPPGPQSLMHGILTLHQKIMDREINR